MSNRSPRNLTTKLFSKKEKGAKSTGAANSENPGKSSGTKKKEKSRETLQTKSPGKSSGRKEESRGSPVTSASAYLSSSTSSTSEAEGDKESTEEAPQIPAADTMALTELEKLRNRRDVAVAKLVATLQDVKAGLATNPNKRKCERLSSTIKEAYQLLEALENELNETEPDALVLDKEEAFEGLAEGEISLRRLVSSYQSKVEDREDALAEESSDKEKKDKSMELVNSIGASSRKFKKALTNTEQYVKEPPEKGLVNIFRTATFGTVTVSYTHLTLPTKRIV